MEGRSESKIPPYQPHQEYVAGHNIGGAQKPFPPLPPDIITPVASLPPAYNGRPHSIHDTTRLTIPQPQPYFSQPSPTFSTVSGKSSHLAVQSWMPSPRDEFAPYASGTFHSHFSQSSLPADIPFVMRFRIFVMRWIIEWWLMEIISWIFSAICMITIIAILFMYDGNELPRWPLDLTLNSVVSVLSASAKAALLLPTAEALGQLKWNWFSKDSRTLIDFEVLDAASRGPMGSLMLLLKAMREKGLNLASIGAIVVILCLPLDLFFQQIISYEQAFIVMPRNASLPRAITYESIGSYRLGGEESLEPDQSMSSIVLPFFYSNGTPPTLGSYCPTSNCTFEPFETLGVCGMCEPLPEEYLEFGCHFGPADWLSTVTNFTGGVGSFPNVTQCGWFLNASDPDTRVLMNGYAFDDTSNARGEELSTRLFPLIDVWTLSPYYGGSVHFRDSSADAILDVLLVGTPSGGEGIRADRRPIAQECALTWCTQTLSSAASWGGIRENITMRHLRNTTELPYPYVVDDIHMSWVNNITFAPTEQHPVTHEDHLTVHESNTFGLSNITALQTALLGQTVAPAYFTTNGDSITYKHQIWSPTGAPTRSVPRNPWLGEIDVRSRFEEIARAMTTLIRNEPSPGGSRELILGTSWDERTHVAIRWEWIILPLFLLALSLVLLLGTVVKSTREESVVGIWKTSVIAILFNGIDDSVSRTVSSNCRMTEARSRARQISVKLVPE